MFRALAVSVAVVVVISDAEEFAGRERIRLGRSYGWIRYPAGHGLVPADIERVFHGSRGRLRRLFETTAVY